MTACKKKQTNKNTKLKKLVNSCVRTRDNKRAKGSKRRRKRRTRTRCRRRIGRKRKRRRERRRRNKDDVPEEDDPVVASFPKTASGDAPLWIMLVLQHHVGHLQEAVDIVKKGPH